MPKCDKKSMKFKGIFQTSHIKVSRFVAVILKLHKICLKINYRYIDDCTFRSQNLRPDSQKSFCILDRSRFSGERLPRIIHIYDRALYQPYLPRVRLIETSVSEAIGCEPRCLRGRGHTIAAALDGRAHVVSLADCR